MCVCGSNCVKNNLEVIIIKPVLTLSNTLVVSSYVIKPFQ
jgi:hypothetical protein